MSLKLNFAQPIVLNKNYIHTIPGKLKCAQCVIGFITFLTLALACRSNYDPYLGTYSGFVGGDLETIAFLFYFETFTISTLILIVYYFSIMSSTIIPKTVFEFVYNFLSCLFISIISICLFIIVLGRNQRQDGFPPEPGFAAKLTSSIFGFVNSILYLVDAFFAYKSYIHD